MYQKTRFQIFKRDNFKCQYCGKTSDEVILEIDHVIPKSKGGTNDYDNLITSCRECNRGKSNHEIIQPRLKSNLCKCDEYSKEIGTISKEISDLTSKLKKLTVRYFELEIKSYQCEIKDLLELYEQYTPDNIRYEPDYKGQTLEEYKQSKLIYIGFLYALLEASEAKYHSECGNNCLTHTVSDLLR